MFRETSPPSTNDTPYGSVRDLPSFRELEQQLSAMKLLAYFIGRRHRHKLIEIERQMEQLATTVDNFYERLGPSHWIFHLYPVVLGCVFKLFGYSPLLVVSLSGIFFAIAPCCRRAEGCGIVGVLDWWPEQGPRVPSRR